MRSRVEPLWLALAHAARCALRRACPGSSGAAGFDLTHIIDSLLDDRLEDVYHERTCLPTGKEIYMTDTT